MIFSIIIPYSQDYPAIWFTLQDKWLRLSENYDWQDYEIIIVNNGSTGDNLELARRMVGLDMTDPSKYSDGRTKTRNKSRRNLTYIEIKDQLHAKAAINIGAWKAKGKYHVHCDSHVLFNNDWLTLAEDFMDNNESCGILHSSVTWNYRVTDVRAYQYFLGVDEYGNRNKFNILGGWSTKKQADKPYRIAASGTCGLVTRGDRYRDLYKGYPSQLRGYSGGEPYLELLTWMMGDEVYVHPDMITTHFACTRSRGYHQGGPYILARNNMLSWYILGGEKWCDVILDDILEKNKTRPNREKLFREMREEAVRMGRFRRKYVEENCVYTLEEVFQLFKSQEIIH